MAAAEAAFHGTPAQASLNLLLFLVPLVLLLVGGRRWSRRRSKQRLNLPLPPSPPGKLPVTGHLHLVGSLPHVSFRDLAQRHGQDLMLLRLGAVNTVVVSSPRAAEAVLRTHDHALASRARSAVADIFLYGSSDVGFAPYGEPWRRARKVVTTHMLSARKVHSFRQDREEEVRVAMAKIRASEDVVTEDELGDMAYLRATVKETLRLHPPAPLLIPHLSMADCEIDGYTIPAGTRLMVNVWALARDPASWERPEEFAPERFLPGGSAAALNGKGNDFEYLPFGSGRRICPGINFANTAVEIMLANLVYHFDWELPAGTEEVDMKEVFSLSIRRKEKLLLVPAPRSLYEKRAGANIV